VGGATKNISDTLVLLQAKEKMESLKNWDKCCELAINQAARMELKAAKCSRTVRNWYQDYRKERRIKVKLLPGKHNMPPFLEQNQDITVVIKQYLCEGTDAAPSDGRYSSDLKLLLEKHGLKQSA
jgi:hypothetical protein